MQNRTNGTVVAVMLLAAAMVASVAASARGRGHGQGQGGNRGAGLQAYLATLPVESISAAETQGLVFTREEEKLARDVYQALGAKWNLRVFQNIAMAEQAHMDGAKAMLDRYRLADPAQGLAPGVFRDASLQLLYNDLVAKGSVSAKEALEAGATIEDLDLRDINALIASSDNQDLDALYQNLAKGSRNHLRAFVSNLATQSSTYAPKYLDTATFDVIVAGERERGVLYDAAGKPVDGAFCDGNGRGRGRGPGGSQGAGQGGGNGVCDGSGPKGSGSGGQGAGKN